MFSDKERNIIIMLVHEEKLKTIHDFDITENNIRSYITKYHEIYSKDSGKLSSSNFRYARKLAGRTLLKYKLSLGATYSSCKEGLVYLIENPSYPEHYKVGMTIDLKSRLNSYQTYDPYKRFSVKHYEFVLNRRDMEKRILNSFSIDVESGEWISKIKSKVFLDIVSKRY